MKSVGKKYMQSSIFASDRLIKLSTPVIRRKWDASNVCSCGCQLASDAAFFLTRD